MLSVILSKDSRRTQHDNTITRTCLRLPGNLTRWKMARTGTATIEETQMSQPTAFAHSGNMYNP